MSPDQPVTSSEGPQQSRKALNASGQSHSSPNIVKPTKSVRQECADDGFTLVPEAKIREVAGDVRRRTNQVPRAEPPPTNRATSSASSQQTSSSRRPQRNGPNHPGNGDSSGSESDDFDRKRKPADAKAAVKKPARRPVLAETPESFSADRSALEDEEMQRMSTFRTMRHLEKTWPVVQHQRHLNRDTGLERKRVLVQAMTKRQGGSENILYHEGGWAWKLQQYVIRLDRQRRDYLDEALFNRFYATLDDGTPDSPEPAQCHKRMVLERVETEVLHRHQGFHALASEPYYPTLQDHLDLESVIRNITVRPRSSQPIVGTLVSQALVDSYVANIVQFSEDLILMGPSSREDRLEMLCNLILDSPSHSGERLDEYIDWIYSGVDRAEFERCCLRAKEFDNFRVKTLPSLNDNSEQVFFSHLDAMYLVSFKEGFATSIKLLPKGDLRFLGWFPSGLGWSLPTDYLRLEYDPEWDSVFVVDANEQILGIYMFPGWVMAWDKDMENLVGIASSGSL